MEAGVEKMRKIKLGKNTFAYPECGQIDCFWAYMSCTGITCDKIYKAIYGEDKIAPYFFPCHSCIRNKEQILSKLKDNKENVKKSEIIRTQDIL